MASTLYTSNSPYANTEMFGNFLDIANFPNIPKNPDDVIFTVNSTYHHRPDLLAFDLYGDAGLWWVFALRNPNVIEDPVYDIAIGKRIYLPKKTSLVSAIGI